MTRPIVTLELQAGPKAGTQFRVSGDRAVIGRSPDVDISLPAKSLSRRHSELEIGDEQVVIRDLGSQNGTFLDNERIAEAVLRDGCTLKIGRVAFTVHIQNGGAVAVPDAAGAALPSSQRPDTAEMEAAEGAAPRPDVTAARQDEALNAYPADGRASRGFLWLALLAVAVIGLGLYGATYLNALQPPPKPPEHFIRVWEDLVILLGRESEGFTDLRVRHPQNREILRWKRFDGLIRSDLTKRVVIIEGLDQGKATVEVIRGGKPVQEFVVHVHGVKPSDYPENLSLDERYTRAQKAMAAAETLRRDQPYFALRQLEAADELFRGARRPRLAQTADRQADLLREELSRQLTALYDEAYRQIRGSKASPPDLLTARQYLTEIKRLVPDQESVDWQLANLVQQIVQETLAARRGRR
ncbi:MAG: FHA domain-containing protein [Planctomycetota bacterium]